MRCCNLYDVHLRQVVQLLQALDPSCTFAHCANNFSYSKVLIMTSRETELRENGYTGKTYRNVSVEATFWIFLAALK